MRSGAMPRNLLRNKHLYPTLAKLHKLLPGGTARNDSALSDPSIHQFDPSLYNPNIKDNAKLEREGAREVQILE